MKVVIHVGMHKTGSSSIQQTFNKQKLTGIEYVSSLGPKGNHSDLFHLLFSDNDKNAKWHGFAIRGDKFIADLPSLSEKWRKSVTDQLTASDDTTFLFSAEAASINNVSDANLRMRDFFNRWTDDIRIIGYVRSPTSFAPSAFQQRLKSPTFQITSIRGVGITSLVPLYRQIFENLDRVFGQDRVTLREFSSERLLNGDVVQDFADQIGARDLSPNAIVRANESLTLEATALLYVQQVFGKGLAFGFPGANRANEAFISQLRQIGAQRLSFSDQMNAKLLEGRSEDIRWIENRLGHSFAKSKPEDSASISSIDDLVDIAIDHYDVVKGILGDSARLQHRPTLENLLCSLEQLQSFCNIGKEQTGQSKGQATKKGSHSMPTGETVEKPDDGLNDVDKALRSKVAFLLWSVDVVQIDFADVTARKEAFRVVRKDYLKKALNFTKRLKNNNLKLTPVE